MILLSDGVNEFVLIKIIQQLECIASSDENSLQQSMGLTWENHGLSLDLCTWADPAATWGFSVSCMLVSLNPQPSKALRAVAA